MSFISDIHDDWPADIGQNIAVAGSRTETHGMRAVTCGDLRYKSR